MGRLQAIFAKPPPRLAIVLVGVSCLMTVTLARAETALPPHEGNAATARTISLDLKGVDILDVLKLLSDKTGLNFVTGHNVTGRVTIFAKDVDVWEAFERIMEANDLAYERAGGIVNVMTARDYELLYGEKFQDRTRRAAVPLKYAKANQFATVLNQLKSAIGRVVVDEPSNTVILYDAPTRLEEMRQLVAQMDQPTQTRIYSLRYAEVDKLREKVQEMLTPGIGTLSFDVRTNKVVVTDLSDAVLRIDRLIRAFDEQEGEVLIEAKIVKVELSHEENLGIDWQQALAGIETKGRANFRVLGDIVDGTSTGAALKFLSGSSGNTQIVIEALKKLGKVDTLSNPRITVLNGQEAKILVGTKEVFVTVTTTVPATGSVVTSPQIQFVDVGTKLFVTPRIKPDGRVQLKIRPEVSTAKVETFQSNRIPIVSTTEAETNVLVTSGTTLIIGGLIESKTEEARNQIPLLGDLPLVGMAFRSRANTERKTELVVFLTPQIISPSGERVTKFASSAFGEPLEQVSKIDEEGDNPLPSRYQALIQALVSSRLSQLLKERGAGEGSVTIAFLIARNGRLVESPEVSSAAGNLFVQTANAALEDVTPFPPFPEEVPAKQVRLRMAVDYHPGG